MHRRREFPAAVKREAFERCRDTAGIPRCEECTAVLSTANVHYDDRHEGEFDHQLADALLGEPTLENCQVLCRTCHEIKTKRDRKLIAKSNHVRDRHLGIRQPVIRPMPGSRASGWSHRINGQWVRR